MKNNVVIRNRIKLESSTECPECGGEMDYTKFPETDVLNDYNVLLYECCCGHFEIVEDQKEEMD